MSKKVQTTNEFFNVGQPVVYAKTGDKNGCVGVITEASTKVLRIAWKLSAAGIPFPEDRSGRYMPSALAPKSLDVLEAVPQIGRGFAFIFPLEGILDVEAMVEEHRKSAELEKNAVQTGFFMIGGVHGDIRYDINARSCPSAPPCKKYLEYDDALADAKEMAGEYGNSYVVLGVAAVVRPKTAPEIKHVVEVTENQVLLEKKS